MRSRVSLRLVLTVCVMLSVPAVCAAPEAFVYPGPGTTVDGMPALNGSRLFTRSILRTPKGQFTELILTGNSIRLLESSQSRYLVNTLELLTGGVTLKTTTGFGIQSQCVTAAPTSRAPARFTVQLQEKTVYVSVHEGEVAVQAKKVVRVEARKTVAVFCASQKQDIVFAGSNVPAKILMGAAAAGTPTALIPQSGSKADMSAENPVHQ